MAISSIVTPSFMVQSESAGYSIGVIANGREMTVAKEDL